MLFKDEYPQISILNFDPTKPPTSIGSGATALTNAQPGALWYDAGVQNYQSIIAGAVAGLQTCLPANVTPVTATNPSVAATLYTVTFPLAGYTNAAGTSVNILSAVGKTIDFWVAGAYTTASGQTPTINFLLTLGGTTIGTWTSTATTASVTKTWSIEGSATVVSTGATGTLETHGLLNIELGAGAAGSVGETSFNDTNVAVSSSVNFTTSLALVLTTTMSSSNAGNSVVGRQLIIEVEN